MWVLLTKCSLMVEWRGHGAGNISHSKVPAGGRLPGELSRQGSLPLTAMLLALLSSNNSSTLSLRFLWPAQQVEPQRPVGLGLPALPVTAP